MLILRGGAGASLTTAGAYYKVLSDPITSIGVIIIAVVIMLTAEWYLADPPISADTALRTTRSRQVVDRAMRLGGVSLAYTYHSSSHAQYFS